MRLFAIFGFLTILGGITITFVISHYDFYCSTRHIFPKVIIDQLDSPVQVTGWDASGILTVDGRRIQLPDFDSLPEASEALQAALARGIEINKDGSVFGLIRIHHWCGSDPVTEHIARVDLAKLLRFSDEGKYHSPSNEEEFHLNEPRIHVTKHGWTIGHYLTYQFWVRHLDGLRKIQQSNHQEATASPETTPNHTHTSAESP